MSVADFAVHLGPGALKQQMAEDVRVGLLSRPKVLPPKYFYDARGSELFDRITRLEEYYPTRREAQILGRRAQEIAALTEAQTLIEIGSGTSEKTRVLLQALSANATFRRFVPFDVDPAVLRGASRTIAAAFPNLEVEPVVGDFEHHLGLLPTGPRRLLAFLGSTIGNLDRVQRTDFFAALRGCLGPGDAFLMGADLVKPQARLVAAYDDALGVTAEFNKNVLSVINRELSADFDPDAFEHVVVWDADQEWIEMRLRSRRSQHVQVTDLQLDVAFDEGEHLRTEISAKFRREGMTSELAAAGLSVTRWWTDPGEDFALLLAEPA